MSSSPWQKKNRIPPRKCLIDPQSLINRRNILLFFYYGQTAYGLLKENSGHCEKYFRNTFIYSSAYFKHCYPVSVQTCKNDLIPQLHVLVRHPEPPQYHLSMQLCISRCKSIFSSLADDLLHNSITTGSLKTQSKNSSGIS